MKGIFMVKLYTKRDLVPQEYYILEYNDVIFNGTVRASMFDDKCIEYIKRIDGAVLEDIGSNKIKTPYGIANITEFSTGLKTLLNIYLLNQDLQEKQICVDITECGGDKLFQCIFAVAEERQVPLLLRHSQISKSFNINIIINDEIEIEANDERLQGTIMASRVR
jgi:hypothetical protein